MSPDNTINMEGQTIGPFHILDRCHVDARRGAKWWVMCPNRHQFALRGTELRKRIREGWEVVCPECET